VHSVAVAANLLLAEETHLDQANPRIQELINVTRNAIHPSESKVYLICPTTYFLQVLEMESARFP
jgi:hypothetical protein